MKICKNFFWVQGWLLLFILVIIDFAAVIITYENNNWEVQRESVY